MGRRHGTMSQDYVRSIAEPPTAKTARRVFWLALTGSVAFGAIAAWHYASLQLTLSHYDARAHLVVARRVIDSLTPGWRQLGSVWLPLPHLLNILPNAWDWSYRTGGVAVAMSVLVFSAGLATLARCLVLRTGSVAAALIAPAVALTNPNVLYLQATPMTEPMLFGLALLSIAAIDAWLQNPSPARANRAGAVLVALVLTRYEGWLVGGALAALAIVLAWRRLPGVQKSVRSAFRWHRWIRASRSSQHGTVADVRRASSFRILNCFIIRSSCSTRWRRVFSILPGRRWHSPDSQAWSCFSSGSGARHSCLFSPLLLLLPPFPSWPSTSVILFACGTRSLVLAVAVLSAFAIGVLPRRFRAIAALLLTAGIIWDGTHSTRMLRWCSRPNGRLHFAWSANV